MDLLPLSGWERVNALTSWLGYAGLLIAAGGSFFLTVVHDGDDEERRRTTAVVVAAAVLAVVARLLAEPVRVLQLTDQGLRSLVDARAYAVTLSTPDGISGLVRLLGLSLLLVGIVRRGSRRGLVMATVGGLIALSTTALAGHTVTGQPQWLVRLADVVHVVAGAIWVGGLALLAMILRWRRDRGDPIAGARLVARFSLSATVALVLVTAAGVSLAWAEVRTREALLTSDYGRLLILKVALVVAVAAIGAYNHRALVPAIRRAARADGDLDGAARAWHRLSRTVRVEVVGLVGVLALTGVLVHVAPPRPHLGGTPAPAHGGGDGE